MFAQFLAIKYPLPLIYFHSTFAVPFLGSYYANNNFSIAKTSKF